MTLDTPRLLLDLLFALRTAFERHEDDEPAWRRMDQLLDRHFCLCKSSMISECPVHGKIER